MVCVVFSCCCDTRDVFCVFFFFKQKTAYEMRISDWSSDGCSSDLRQGRRFRRLGTGGEQRQQDNGAEPAQQRRHHYTGAVGAAGAEVAIRVQFGSREPVSRAKVHTSETSSTLLAWPPTTWSWASRRSEEHTSELQLLMRSSYDDYSLKKQQTTE